jgi:hypothetical protein
VRFLYKNLFRLNFLPSLGPAENLRMFHGNFDTTNPVMLRLGFLDQIHRCDRGILSREDLNKMRDSE